MSIRALKTLLVVARHGSFAGAAREIGVTQAAISLQMKSLEREVRTSLFDRVGRTVVLNTSGRALVGKAGEIISLYENLAPRAGRVETLSVGVTRTISGDLVFDALRRLGKKRSLQVRVTTENCPDLVSRIERGELDVALVGMPSSRLSRALIYHPISREPLVLIAPRDLRPRRARELFEHQTLIRLDTRTSAGKEIEHMLSEKGMTFNEAMEFDNVRDIIETVARGCGISLLFMHDRVWQSHPGLQGWHVKRLSRERLVGAIERRSHAKSVLTTELLSCVHGSTEPRSKLRDVKFLPL